MNVARHVIEEVMKTLKKGLQLQIAQMLDSSASGPHERYI
jgi:hypothetical protein